MILNATGRRTRCTSVGVRLQEYISSAGARGRPIRCGVCAGGGGGGGSEKRACALGAGERARCRVYVYRPRIAHETPQTTRNKKEPDIGRDGGSNMNGGGGRYTYIILC